MLWSAFLPDQCVSSIYELDIEAMWREGFRGLIADLDNTLVGTQEPDATPELVAWLTSLKERGFQVAIVSNNNLRRVRRFAGPLSVPFFYNARKPRRRAFRQALRQFSLPPQQTLMVGDQLLTDVWGGNRMGMRTVWVVAISPREGKLTRINRLFEHWVLTQMIRRGIWRHERSR